MSWKEIKPGDKKAKPVAARFAKSKKKGTLGIEVVFEFEEPSTGTPERLNWMGWVSPNAIENTMDTLVNVLGYNGNDEVFAEGHAKEGQFVDPNVLNWNGEVKLVVEHEEYEGKSYPKIKWVNKLGGSSFANCAPQTLKADLEKLGFRAAFLAAKQVSTQASVDASKVPF